MVAGNICANMKNPSSAKNQAASEQRDLQQQTISKGIRGAFIGRVLTRNLTDVR
jgi:hypothetical protein